ncbi:MAG: hypothetical protein ACKOAF_02110 [Actinomycetes bacterium]
MSEVDCFIGVVSHEGSRFAISQGPQGLAAFLRERFQGSGIGSLVQVNTRNLHDPDSLPIDASVVQETLSAELRLQGEWASYLRAGGSPSIVDAARSLVRTVRRATRRFRSPSPASVRRLVNIELSHLDLMRGGLASGAEWVLILEDDAFAPDLDDCARGLVALMRDCPANIGYVNVSQSFTNAELGIEHLLSSVIAPAWDGSVRRSVLSASRPVTNTVCAILYRREFLSVLVEEMDALPMTPVVPIDWKLNIALMDLFESGRLRDGSCLLVEPAPIDQMSMRA